MKINKKVLLDHQSGRIEATATTTNGKEVIIRFNYSWDEKNNKLEGITDGKIIEEGEDVAFYSYFPYTGHKVMSLKTPKYSMLAEYSKLIIDAISTLG